MKMLTYTFASLVCLLFLAVFVVLNMPVQQFVDFESMGMEVENTGDARVKSGVLRMRSADLVELGIFELSWKWCPNRVILNWCADLNSEPLHADGQIGYRLSGAIDVSEAQFELDSLSLLGVVPAILDARLTGQIRSLDIVDFVCPLRNAKNLVALVEMRDPKILGNALKSIRADISQDGTDYLIDLSGEQVNGGFRVNTSLYYSGKGEIAPPANLIGLMDSMAIPLGNGRYAWELEGQVPC